MSPNWQCRLYGHQWHHAGVYEVVITDDGPIHPYRCGLCGRETVIHGHGVERDGGGSGTESSTIGTTTESSEEANAHGASTER